MPPEDQFREKTWEEQQEEARRIMAEQQEAIAASKTGPTASEAEEEQLPEMTAQALDRERGARWSRALSAARTAGRAATGGADASPQLAELDAKIAGLENKAAGGWQGRYLMLTVGAAVCDLLQLVSDATVLLALLGSAFGAVFSASRYIVLRMESRRIGDSKLLKEMTTRTLISGAISLIPIVDMLPEQTGGMLLEWRKRREIADAASSDLAALRKKRDDLVARLEQEAESQEPTGA